MKAELKEAEMKTVAVKNIKRTSLDLCERSGGTGCIYSA